MRQIHLNMTLTQMTPEKHLGSCWFRVADQGIDQWFLLDLFNPGAPFYRLGLRHNQRPYFEIQYEEDQQRMEAQTDQLSRGQWEMLHGIEQGLVVLFQQLDSPEAQAVKSDQRIVAKAKVVLEFDELEVFQAVCKDLLALPPPELRSGADDLSILFSQN